MYARIIEFYIVDPGFCNKCGNSGKYKEYFQIQCTNFDQYLKCQSKCVILEAKSPFDCTKNSVCRKKCESRCKTFWPGTYFVIQYLYLSHITI